MRFVQNIIVGTIHFLVLSIYTALCAANQTGILLLYFCQADCALYVNLICSCTVLYVSETWKLNKKTKT